KEHHQSFVERNVECVFELYSPHPMVMGSRDKLKQVFLNLILNARDAMPEGGKLTFSARTHDKLVRILIRDTGTGIVPEILPKIFDAFFTTKKEVSGVGLGLSVSYGIVQQHTGTISVSSTIGEGTTFTIELPVIKENNV
ncbi:MAG: ATP-binding protein, partial [bacterium]